MLVLVWECVFCVGVCICVSVCFVWVCVFVFCVYFVWVCVLFESVYFCWCVYIVLACVLVYIGEYISIFYFCICNWMHS